MSLSISGPASVQPADRPAPAAPAPKQAAQTQQSAQTQPSARPKPSAPPQASGQSQQSTDTVSLSQTAQVLQLSEQGQSPSQIAAELGIPVSTVNSDLETAVATPQPAAPTGSSA